MRTQSLSERDTDFWSVSILDMVKPGLAGSSKGGRSAGLLEMPSCLRVPVPFTTGLASFREPGKSQMWISHSCNHHSMVPSAQSWHYWYFQHSFPNTPTTLRESPLNKRNFCSLGSDLISPMWAISGRCLPCASLGPWAWAVESGWVMPVLDLTSFTQNHTSCF